MAARLKTRPRILLALRDMAGATAGVRPRALARSAKLHVATVRKHLAVMRREGTVAALEDRRGYFTYSLPAEPVGEPTAVEGPLPSEPPPPPTDRERVLLSLGLFGAGSFEVSRATGIRLRDLDPILAELVGGGSATRQRERGRWVYRRAS